MYGIINFTLILHDIIDKVNLWLIKTRNELSKNMQSKFDTRFDTQNTRIIKKSLIHYVVFPFLKLYDSYICLNSYFKNNGIDQEFK